MKRVGVGTVMKLDIMQTPKMAPKQEGNHSRFPLEIHSLSACILVILRCLVIILDMDNKKLYFFQDKKCLGCAFDNLKGTVYPAVSVALDTTAEILLPKWIPSHHDLID
jgi:hypothetical protein